MFKLYFNKHLFLKEELSSNNFHINKHLKITTNKKLSHLGLKKEVLKTKSHLQF